MKAERRHELKENDLAHIIGQARVYLSEHGTKLALIALAVAAVIVVITVAMQSSTAGTENAWRQKQALAFTDVESGKASLDTLNALVSESKDDSFVLTSLIDQGTHALRLSQEAELPPDEELNNKARKAFTQLLSKFSANPLAFGAAHSGLATVAENDFAIDGESSHKEEARKHLTAITSNPALATTPLPQFASDRLARLDSVFTLVRFAPPLPPEEVTSPSTSEPTAITPTRITPDQLPEDIRKQFEESLGEKKPTDEGAAPTGD